MTVNIEDFFPDSNAVSGFTENEYSYIPLLVSAVEAFARSTYKYVYIVDYFKKDFIYTSSNLPYIFNLTLEQVKELGYNIFTNSISKDEHEMLLEINKAGFDFLENLPVEDRKKWFLTYDIHIFNGKRKRLINHTITPIYLTKDGRVWLALCTIALSTGNKAGNIVMRKMGSNTYYEYSLYTHKWDEKVAEQLSEEEKDVLILSAQGCTMSDMADRMCKSVDTIKSYKRRIFKKLNVSNIAEALTYATNYKLL